MTGEAPQAKKPGRKKGKAFPSDARFYITLSAEAIAMVTEMAEPRGGFARAKAVVIEEAVRLMHAEDRLIKGRKKRKAEEA